MTTQSYLAVHDDIFVIGYLTMALAQLIQRDVHRTRDGTGSKLLRTTHIDEQCSGVQATLKFMPLHRTFSAHNVVIDKARKVDGVLS